MSRNAFPPIPPAWLPSRFDAGDWNSVVRRFDELDRRPVRSPAELERWLRDFSELSAALAEEDARRYIAMTCHTEDKKAEARYLAFQRDIVPKAKPRWQRLKERYIALPARRRLPKARYFVFDRAAANEVAIFRKANVPLETRETELAQRYNKVMGAMTVVFGGRERTLQQMGRFLEVNDRSVRESAWRLVAGRYLRDRDAIDGIFDRLVALRDRIGRNAGYRNYRDYAFRMHGRFDYGVRECEAYHRAVERVVVPAIRRLNARRRARLALPALRPWDLAVDPGGRAPLRPFEKAEEMARGVREIFRRVSPDLARDFQAMRDGGLLDLESRKGKAPGGYQYTLDVARVPFIFMNAAGLQRDVETLLHEGGHAFHALWARKDPLVAYRHAPIEFCEVASQGMEVIGLDHLDVFYGDGDAGRAREKWYEGVVTILAWIALIDAFQHWIYTHPRHTREQRRAAWLALRRRFGGDVDWSGLEEAHASMWHKQLHLFSHPFYYIEYGISLIGALQLWQQARKDRKGALRRYRASLSLGGSRPLPELFRACGLRFDFGERILAPLVGAVMREMGF
jgi:oligoendopeptidase F